MFLFSRFIQIHLFLLFFGLSQAIALAPESDLSSPLDFDPDRVAKQIEAIEEQVRLGALNRPRSIFGVHARELIAENLEFESNHPLQEPSYAGDDFMNTPINRLTRSDFQVVQRSSKSDFLIVLYEHEPGLSIKRLPEWKFPILASGKLKVNGYGSIHYQVYPSEIDLEKIPLESRETLALKKLVASFGVNPDWVTDELRVIAPYAKLKGLTRKANEDGLLREVKPLLEQGKEGEYPDFPKGKTRTRTVHYFGPDKIYGLFFHELFHDVYFTEVFGPKNRKEFRKLLYDPEVKNYIQRAFPAAMFYGKMVRFDAFGEITVSDVFATIAAVYYNQVYRDEKRVSAQLIVFPYNWDESRKMPQSLKTFLRKLKFLPHEAPLPDKINLETSL